MTLVGNTNLLNTSNVSGTLTLSNIFIVNSGSTLTVSGTINGGSALVVNDTGVLGTGGTLNATVDFDLINGNDVLIPARVYNGLVVFNNTALPGSTMSGLLKFWKL